MDRVDLEKLVYKTVQDNPRIEIADVCMRTGIDFELVKDILYSFYKRKMIKLEEVKDEENLGKFLHFFFFGGL